LKKDLFQKHFLKIKVKVYFKTEKSLLAYTRAGVRAY